MAYVQRRLLAEIKRNLSELNKASGFAPTLTTISPDKEIYLGFDAASKTGVYIDVGTGVTRPFCFSDVISWSERRRIGRVDVELELVTGPVSLPVSSKQLPAFKKSLFALMSADECRP